MVSFLKRRKSTINNENKNKSSSAPAMPKTQPQTPSMAMPQGTKQSMLAPPHARSMKSDLSMPDLRFSTMDLDAHVQSAVGVGQAPGSSSTFKASPAERPRSRMLLFGARSTDDLQQRARGSADAAHAHANGSQLGVPMTQARSSSANHSTLPRSASSSAPSSAQHSPSIYSTSAASSPKLVNVNSSPSSTLDKKQAKRLAKERAALEKERIKQAAKDQKESGKRANRLSTQSKHTAPPSLPPTAALPPKPEMRRALNSATNVKANVDAQSDITPPQETKPIPSEWRAVSNANIHAATAVEPDQSALPPQTRQSSRVKPSTTPVVATQSAGLASPADRTSSEANHSDRGDTSKHAVTLTASSSSSQGTSISLNGGKKTRSSLDTDVSGDEGQSSSFVTSDELFTPARSPAPSVQPRARPARDEERAERVQSRMSMSLDNEAHRLSVATQSLSSQSGVMASATSDNASAKSAPRLPPITTSVNTASSSTQPETHKRTESSASKLSTFSAMLSASRPGGAADRSVEQEAKAQEEAAAQQQQERRAQYYRQGARAEQSIMARSGLMGKRDEQDDDKAIHAQRQKTQQQQPPGMLQEVVKRVRETFPVNLTRTRTVQKSLQCSGDGWECLGVGDEKPVDSHWRTVIETIKVAHYKTQSETGSEEEDKGSQTDKDAEERSDSDEEEEKEVEIEYRDEEVEAHYNDLFESLFTSTTPDVIARLLSHLEIGEVKALRQTSSAVRLAVGAQREWLLNQHFSGIGYKTWTQVRGTASAYRARMAGQLPANANKDPCPLTLQDLEAFLIGQDLLPEYAVVGREYSRDPQAMDPAIARLARATTRAHNRVLTRLRLQPVYKPPTATIVSSTKKSSSPLSASPSISSTTGKAQNQGATISRHNSYYEPRRPTADFDATNAPPLPTNLLTQSASNSPMVSPLPSPLSGTSASLPPVSPQPDAEADVVAKKQLQSPWKPGRAAYFRVWVPAMDASGWLSDEELAQCEQELYKAGIWQYLRRGDIVWDTAVGDQLNEGKYVFDGHYLRDLSYAFDVAGHLPSWLNVVMFSPSYWHNIIRSSVPQPVVFLDITPWRDQILDSLRLVQDQVDTFSGHGARYRIAKWLYRSAANITHGQIISRMNGGLEIVDEAWHGRIVIETDGTAESAKLLVGRCAGPDATPQEKAALLANVMGDATAAGKALNVHDTNGMASLARPVQYNKFSSTMSSQAKPLGSNLINRRNEPRTSAWAIMRERSRPGLIWLRPLGERERILATA